MSVFALVDCNNFYASCERVFQPHLEGKPVVILSNNDGCFIARSNEAKALGIPMGAPYFKYKDICDHHNVAVFSSNFQLYGDMSRRVMENLKILAPEVAVYSIDEAFLRLDRMKHFDLYAYGIQLRQKIQTWTGLPISIGIATSKTLAKVANLIGKKTEEIVDLRDEETCLDALSQIEVQNIWGVGRNIALSLNAMGIFTALELRNSGPKQIRKRFGVMGEKLVLELRGQSCYDFKDEPQSRNNILSFRSFGKTITSLEELKEAVANYAATAVVKMRKQKSLVNSMYVFIRTDCFKNGYSNQGMIYNFSTPTNDNRVITSKVNACLNELFILGSEYKKAGIILMNLTPENSIQGNIFETIKIEKSSLLMNTIDKINQTMGRSKLFFASQGLKRSWEMKHELRSPCFTTNWNDLVKVC